MTDNKDSLNEALELLERLQKIFISEPAPELWQDIKDFIAANREMRG